MKVAAARGCQVTCLGGATRYIETVRLLHGSIILASALGIVLIAAPAPADKNPAKSDPRLPWAQAKTPKKGKPRAIGGYRAGCIQGAAALPKDGKGFQVMRMSRKRYYGHPNLIAFIRKLAAAMHEKELGVLLVGDLSQPRGGPTIGGHASHQSGLDADLWYTYPEAATRRSLTRKEREDLPAHAIVDLATKSLTDRYSPRIASMLELAASDRRVERIFVHPTIKRALCQSTEKRADKDRAWLGKIRPWWGHHDHFHVRLACPESSPDCEPQASVGASHGCDKLDWWFSGQSQTARKKGRKSYRKRIAGPPPLPERCQRVLR